MGRSEPPSSRTRTKSPVFYIGKNSRGSWVVQDREHLHGGLFISRTEALKFALLENGHRPQAVVMVPGILELDMSRTLDPVAVEATSTPSALRRAA